MKRMMDTKQIAELATRIVVAMLENGKENCSDIGRVCEMYRAISVQISDSDRELSKAS